VENKCLLFKKEMAFVNIVGSTITTDLGNVGYLGYLYIRVEVSGSVTRESMRRSGNTSIAVNVNTTG
jgi:hypothetical protein